MLGPHGRVPSLSCCSEGAADSSLVSPVPPSLVKPKATVQHWELQPDCGEVGILVHGRWLCRGSRGGTPPPCWCQPRSKPLLSLAVSQIITQDYCEAVEQLELEQDLRLHAEAFAHEVRLDHWSPCPRVLGGGGILGVLLAFSISWCRNPNPRLTAGLALDPKRMGMLLGTHHGPLGWCRMGFAPS